MALRSRSSFIFLGFLSVAACKKDVSPPPAPVAAPVVAKAPISPSAAPRVISMEVTSDGFVPEQLSLKANEPVKLVVTRKTDETCATDLLIDGTDINVPLPLDKAVEVAFTPTKAGKVKFGCAMDKMVGGVLLVE